MLRMRKCHACNKEFIPSSQHLYKLVKNNKKLWFCSYTCWRTFGGDSKRRRDGVQGY